MQTILTRSSPLDYLSVYPDDYDPSRPYPLVICLHGFGADMHDLAGLAPALSPTAYRWVLPNAPLDAFEDGTGRAWYERGGLESPGAVRQALEAFDLFVQEVFARHPTPPGRAVLLGFSQGGGVALRYGLPRPEVFAGIAVLSGSLRRLEGLRSLLPSGRSQRLFVAHGLSDEVVPFEVGVQLKVFLEEARYQPSWRGYPMGHGISPAVVEDLREWLSTTLLVSDES